MKRLAAVTLAVIAALAFGGGVSAQGPFPSPQSPPKGLPLPSKAPGFAAPSPQFNAGAGYADSSEAVAQYAEPPQSYTTTTITVLRSAPVVVTRSYAAASYATSGGCRQQNFGAGVYGAGGGCDNGPAVNPNFGAGAGYGYGNSFGAAVQVGPRFGAGRHNRGIPGAGGILGIPGRILRGPRTN